MTLEEMKKELEKNGYVVEKKVAKVDHWAMKAWRRIGLYALHEYGPRDYQRSKGGTTRDVVTKYITRKYGYENLGSIPKDERDRAIEEMVEFGRKYVDRKHENNWERL